MARAMKTHIVDLTGDYETTIYEAARKLLADGADPQDQIETWRGGKLSMSGIVGQSAKVTVWQNKKGKPSLSLVRWMPFPARAGQPEMALDEILGP